MISNSDKLLPGGAKQFPHPRLITLATGCIENDAKSAERSIELLGNLQAYCQIMSTASAASMLPTRPLAFKESTLSLTMKTQLVVCLERSSSML